MATAIETQERRAGGMAMTAERWEKFLFRLGDPTEWEFTGVVNDLGKPTGSCICGHAIQFEFGIQNPRTGDKAHVGSVCINHFQEISPALYAKLTQAQADLDARIKAAKKASRDAAQAIEVEAARVEWEALATAAKDRLARYRADGQRAPYNLYWMVSCTRFTRGPKEYKRACDYIRWYKSASEVLNRYETEGWN